MQKVSNYKTAVAYAKAWFEAAKDHKAEDAVFEEARALREGIGDVLTLWNSMASPIESEHEKIEIISQLASKTKLSAITEEMLKITVYNNRLKLIPLILDEFIHLYYQDKGIIEVFAESAVPLSETQSKKLQKVLEKKLQSPIFINYQVNPAVLGGLSVRFQSYLIDDTIQNKLEKLEKLLIKEN